MKPIDIVTDGRHSQFIQNNLCTWCRDAITGFTDELSEKEHRISGFCQKCQDKTFSDEFEAACQSCGKCVCVCFQSKSQSTMNTREYEF